MLAAIESFLEGRRDTVDANRVLTTVVTASLQPSTDASDERAAFEAHVRKQVEWYRGRVLSIESDLVQAAFGGPARAIRYAVALAAAGPRFGRPMKAGLHTGECDVVGSRMRGPALDLSARLSQMAIAGEVLVSRTVRDLVAGSGLAFESRGAGLLGDDGQHWDVFAARVPVNEVVSAG